MRIAVCFSAQIRTGVESSKNIKRYLGELLPYCDFFIHTWDQNTTKNYNAARIISKPKKVSNEQIDKIIEIYKPKKIVIDNFEKILENETLTVNGNKLFQTCPPLWYSFMKSVEFKKEYEYENKFEYDYVLKLRLDIIFPKARNLKNEITIGNFENTKNIYIENRIPNIDENTLYVDDVYFISNSKTMDIASSYYNQITHNLNHTKSLWPYGYGFPTHLLRNNLNIIDIQEYIKKIGSFYGYTIYREECLHYSCVDEYDKCRECESYYFGPLNQENLSKNYYVEDLKKIYVIESDIHNVESGKSYYIDELKLK
jgi:hypothetical protein